ncbi:MAG: sulfatase family protein [Leadbetterella sp.]
MKKILLFLFFTHVVWAQKKPNILIFIADDWSKHAGIYGDNVVKTPNIDRIAKQGVVFENAFCSSPSCSPSRAAILTGMYPHQLESGANLHGTLAIKYPNYTQILKKNNYHVGVERKGWGPGNFEIGGYTDNPAGKVYDNFDEFLKNKKESQPFCFWFGTFDPHRPYKKSMGVQSGIDSSKIEIPRWLPNHGIVKEDIADYYYEVQRFDKEIGQVLEHLERIKELDNTLIIITSDNGMPFPRAKANVYDSGSNVPLILYWKNKVQPFAENQNTFVNLMDIAPTILEAVGLKIPKEMKGKSLVPFLLKTASVHQKEVFIERERHANVRKGNESYPVRAIRNDRFLYIKNFEPDLYPAGDPEKWYSVGSYGDVDASPTKDFLIENKLQFQVQFDQAFTKRPAEELYDLALDPLQLNNIISYKKYANDLAVLRIQLKKWMKSTQDPRLTATKVFTEYPYYGQEGK